MKPHYIVGNNVTLTCFVTKPNPHYVDINTTVNIQWSSHKRISNHYFIHIYNQNFNHTLTNIKLSDAGEYNCSYYLTSANDNPYIKSSDVKTEATILMIKSKLGFMVIIKHHSLVVPKGNNPSIAPLLNTYGIGSSIDLICYATYSTSSFIDVTTHMNMKWLISSNHTLHSYTGLNDYTEHTLNYTISNVKLSDAGQYTCSVFINTLLNNNVILDSGTTSNSIIITIECK